MNRTGKRVQSSAVQDISSGSGAGCVGGDTAQAKADVEMWSGDAPNHTHGSYGTFNSLQGCRVELWYSRTIGSSSKTEIRYYPVAQAIKWTAAPSEQVVGGANVTVSAEATTADANVSKRKSTGKSVTFSSDTPAICSVVNATTGVIKAESAGKCIIKATAAGDANPWDNVSGKTYLAQATSTIDWQIKASQTITVTTEPPANAAKSAPFTTAARSSSGLVVSIDVSGACTRTSSTAGSPAVTTATVTMTGGGNCTIAYTQQGDATRAPAPMLSRTVTLVKSTQTLTFNAQANQVYAPGKIFDISPLATSNAPGVTPTYSIAAASASVCEITGTQGNRILVLNAGACTINANAAANDDYNAAAQKQQTITITKASKTINVTQAAPTSAEASSSFNVAASSAPGENVAITWSGTGCTTGSATNSATITVGAGGTTCTVKYNSAATTNYLAAPEITSSVPVTKLLQNIVITTAAPAKHYMQNGAFTVAAQARKTDGTASGLQVTISTEGGCTGGGTSSTANITLTDATNPCTIKYNQAGNGTYEPAVERINTTEAIRKNQAITVTQAAPTRKAKGESFTVTAQSNATPVANYKVTIATSGACTGSGAAGSAVITMNSNTGTCSISYNQAGDNEYYPAQQVLNVVQDGTAPVIAEVTPIAAKTNQTPSYTFTSDEVGSLLLSGACSTANTAVESGTNTIVMNELAAGTYNNCKVRVMDAAGNISNQLTLSAFEVVVGVKGYIKPVATGTGDCSSWANACANIQTALDDNAIEEIWLTKGVYRPTTSLQMKQGKHIVGGFAGGETSASKADPAKNLTIISGDSDYNDNASGGIVKQVSDISGSNLANLVVAQNLNNFSAGREAKLTGVILNAASAHALLVNKSNVKLDKVKIIANKGANGAGVWLENGATVVASNTLFEANQATGKGGAIAADGNAANRITINASTFADNKAATSGGAIAFVAGKLDVLNSTFYANQATNAAANGGAIDLASITSPSEAKLRYVTMLNNSAGASSGKGGAIHVASGANAGMVTLMGGLIVNNTAKTAGNISDMAKITDAGFNIVGFNGASATLTGSSTYAFSGTSQTSHESDLEKILETELKNNGGFTPTLALAYGSVAINKVPAVHQDCSGVKYDQRGKARPDLNTGNCDIGAVEDEGLDYCTRVQGHDKGLSLNQDPETGLLCGNGWQLGMGGGSTSWYILLLTALIGLRRLRQV